MQFEIDLKKVGVAKDALQQDTQKFNNIIAHVTYLKNTCPFSGRDRQGLVTSLNNTLLSLNNQRTTLKKWTNSLSDVSNTYIRYENENIYGNINAGQVDSETVSADSIITGESGKKSDENYLLTTSNLWKVIGSAGLVGNAVSFAGSFATQDNTLKNVVGSFKYLTKAVDKGIDVVSNYKSGNTSWYNGLLGFNDGLKGIDTTSWDSALTSAIEKEIKNLTFSKDATIAENGKVASKWAGNILTAVTNGIENYDEYKSGDIDAKRAVQETVIETVVDCTMSSLATVGVTTIAAGLVSAGVIASAPAILVAAGSAVLVMGANAACKWVTGGKDIGEVVADGLCDLQEKIDEVGSAVVRAGVNTVKEGANAVKNGLSSAWSGICSVFG